MLPLHRYSLCLLLLVTVYASSKGKHSHTRGVKEKRDIDDLRDDPLLLSIFKSDIQEKRKDRSISTEQETKDTTPKESLKNIDTTTTDTSRVARDIDLANTTLPIPHNLFANFADTPMVGSQVPLGEASKLFSYDGKSADETAVVPQLFQANYMPLANLEMTNPAFHAPMTDNKRDFIEKPSIESKPLLEMKSIETPLSVETPDTDSKAYDIVDMKRDNLDRPTVEWTPEPEMKRDVIAKPDDYDSEGLNEKRDMIERPALDEKAMQAFILGSNAVKEDTKRASMDMDDMSLGALNLNPMLGMRRDFIDLNPTSRFFPDSMPLRLRKFSAEISKRGAPVFNNPQYGETVASVEDALQKKSLIPEVPYLLNVPQVNPSTMSTMYSNDIIKKDDIPEATLPGSEGGLDEAILKPDDALKGSDGLAAPAAINTPLSALAAANAAPAAPASTTAAGESSPASGAAPAQQKSTVDAPQVQNLDGTITRPLIKEDDMCADQYATCADFAKAEYCTKYPDLMKIQCRKSCGYCVPGQRDVVEEPAKAKGNSTDTKSTVDTEAAPADAKSTDAPKSDTKADAKADTKGDTKADAKADAKAAKVPESAKNETEGTKKSTTPAVAKPLNGSSHTSKKSAVSSKKSKKEQHEKGKHETEAPKAVAKKEEVKSKKDATKADTTEKTAKKTVEEKKSDVSEAKNTSDEKKKKKDELPTTQDKDKKKNAKSKVETKPETKKSQSKKSKAEKTDEGTETEKIKDGKDQKSKIAESESGSTNEGDANEAESGDFGSGETSGSGSGSGDEAEPTVLKNVVPEKSKKVVLSAAATKATITKAKEDKKKDDKKKETKSKVAKAAKKKDDKKDDKKLEVKNKITTVIKQTKSNLGEFTLPVIKSEVSTASLALNDKSESEESGSGSGSGDDEAEEQTIPAKKEAVVEKPKAKTKVPAKKEVKEVKVAKAAKEVKKSEKPKAKESKAKATKKSTKATKKVDKPAKKNKILAKEPKEDKPVKDKVVTKKSIVPRGPKKTMPYPKIDLRLIASALAHYEEAALELAGEYPKQGDAKEQEVSRSSIPKPEAPAAPAAPATPTAAVVAPAAPVVATPSAAPAEKIEKESRSFIPHAPMQSFETPFVSAQPYFAPIQETKKEVIIDPLEKYRQNLQIAKILTDDRNGRSTIPKYLRLTKDVHTTEEEEDKMEKSKADSLTAVQKRFNILGVEPTLIDYYAETGKINPFAKKKKKESNVKKSAINANSDPYEYLRNMPAGASMLPIDDPKARSKVPSDHSYPVFLMKVSPGERKYIEEPPRRRGEIRHLNAEGVEMDETTESNGIPKDIVTEMQQSAATAAKKTHLPPPAPVQNPFVIPANAPLSMINMMNTANNLRSSLLKAQGGAAQTKAGVRQAPKPAAKTQVPKPAPKPAPAPSGELTDAAAKAMERSAMSIGMQYAQSQMKAMQQQQKKANARARFPNPKAPRGPPARAQPPQLRNRIMPPINFHPQNNLVKPGTGIARATSPLLNPAFAMDPQMNQNMLSESG